MKWTRLATLSLCAALAVCVAAQMAFAAVVVVDGNNYSLLNWVPYLKQSVNNNASYAFADMAPGHGTIGVGAFYAGTGTGAGTGATAGGQVWLGTDQYVGTRLRDITKLEYTTYTYVCGAGPAPAQNDYARQPIQLQLAIQTTPGGQSAYLMHRPWGMIGQNDGNDVLHMGFWETWNAKGSDLWYVAYSESLVGEQWTWDQIILSHPDAVLATPPFATNWDVPFTGTSCSLNFEVGCRKRGNAVVFGTTNYGTWWKEAENFRGYLDKFTIEAIDTTTDPPNPVTVIPDTTYDFEGANPMAKTVFMTHRTAWDKSITLNRDENYMFSDQAFQPSAEHQGSFVRLFGKVVEWAGFYKPYRIDDGSGQPVKVIAPDHEGYEPSVLDPDIYVMVTGTLKQILWENEIPPVNDRTITCRAENVVRIYP